MRLAESIGSLNSTPSHTSDLCQQLDFKAACQTRVRRISDVIDLIMERSYIRVILLTHARDGYDAFTVKSGLSMVFLK